MYYARVFPVFILHSLLSTSLFETQFFSLKIIPFPSLLQHSSSSSSIQCQMSEKKLKLEWAFLWVFSLVWLRTSVVMKIERWGKKSWKIVHITWSSTLLCVCGKLGEQKQKRKTLIITQRKEFFIKLMLSLSSQNLSRTREKRRKKFRTYLVSESFRMTSPAGEEENMKKNHHDDDAEGRGLAEREKLENFQSVQSSEKGLRKLSSTKNRCDGSD